MTIETNHAGDDNTSNGKGQGIEAEKKNHCDASDTSTSPSAPCDATAVVRFRIGGLLRFLSHAETLRVLERACIRAHVPIKYTQGFNPHPKLSLPLPRTVGVESDNELLAVKLFESTGIALDERSDETGRTRATPLMKALAGTLPNDIVIHSVTLVKSNTSFHPSSARYVFLVRQEGRSATVNRIKDRVADIQSRESLTIERTAPKRREGRRIDVRPFLKSICVEDAQVVVECKISNAGSIRVDEIMMLLELTPADLEGPVRRTNVVWEIT